LLLLSAPKQVGLADMEEMFNSCFTVIETSEWIEKINKKEIKKGPIKELAETVYLLQKNDREPPEIAALRQKNHVLGAMLKEDIKMLVTTMESLVPGFMTLEGEIVSISVKPQKFLEAVQASTNTDIPTEFREAYQRAFE